MIEGMRMTRPVRLTPRQIRSKLDDYTEQFQDAFIEAVRDIRSDVQFGLVAEAIERGNLDDAIRLMHMSVEFFDGLRAEQLTIYRQGGVDAVAAVSGLPAPFRPQEAALWRALEALTRARKPK